jgi:GAF domain-containing protein
MPAGRVKVKRNSLLLTTTTQQPSVQLPQTITTTTTTTTQKTKNLLHVLRTIRHCNRAADLDTSIALVIENTTELLGCDRATLFMVDELHSQLVIRKAVGMEDHVRIPWDQGLAGHVFHNGVTLNIPDVYQDNRFSGLIDAQSGYRTRSLLCAPVQDADNVTVAVIQAINKKAATADNSAASRDGCGDTENNSSSSGGACEAFVPFTMEDELLIDHLALQVGIILRNQIARDSIVRSHEQVVALLDIVRSLHSDLGLASLMFTITEKSPGLVDADR